MAETATLGRPRIDTRGSLDIRDRVVERVARHAALAVPGVLRRAGRVARMTGTTRTATGSASGLPRVHVTTANGHVSLVVEVAVAWPRPVAATAAAVRARVADDVRTLTGLVVDSAHVHVGELVVSPRPWARGPDDPDEDVR